MIKQLVTLIFDFKYKIYTENLKTLPLFHHQSSTMYSVVIVSFYWTWMEGKVTS